MEEKKSLTRAELGELSVKAFQLENTVARYYDIGDIDTCLEYETRLLEIYKKIGGLRKVAVKANRIGILHHDKEDYDMARKFYKQTLETYTKFNDSFGIMTSYGNIGSALCDNGRLKEAMTSFQHALSIANKFIAEDIDCRKEKAGYLNMLGIILHELEDLDRALSNYQQSLLTLKSIKMGSSQEARIIKQNIKDLKKKIRKQR